LRKPRNSRKGYVFVFNSTTLIVLRELERIDLLEQIRGLGSVKIVIPQGVREEFLDAGIELGITSDEIDIDFDKDVFLPDIPQSLGEGERHAITLAYALEHDLEGDDIAVVVVTDDKRARNTCKRLGVKVIGTLGLVEFSKKHGVISKREALELLERIPSTSLYITPELLREARTKIEQQPVNNLNT